MKTEIFFREESGQGMVEYSLILGLVALATIGTLRFLGQGVIKPMYEVVKDKFPKI